MTTVKSTTFSSTTKDDKITPTNKNYHTTSFLETTTNFKTNQKSIFNNDTTKIYRTKLHDFSMKNLFFTSKITNKYNKQTTAAAKWRELHKSEIIHIFKQSAFPMTTIKTEKLTSTTNFSR